MSHLRGHKLLIYVAALMLFTLAVVSVTAILDQTASARSGQEAYKHPNAGKGNGQETLPAENGQPGQKSPDQPTDYDPGNSAGKNKAGPENGSPGGQQATPDVAPSVQESPEEGQPGQRKGQT